VSADPELLALDAMLTARLDALTRHADVSFALESEPVDPQISELLRLVERARAEGEAVSFALEGDDEGVLARARRECEALLHDVVQRASHPLTVESGAGHPRIRTRMGWTGDITTFVAPDASHATLAAHAVVMQATLATSLHRLRLLTMIVTATGKIATMIATPGAAVLALPIAYRCVREVYEQWSTPSPTCHPCPL
jgi:hypothetical protein